MAFPCPVCGHRRSAVVDSRAPFNFKYLRRRRHCAGCGHPYTTREIAIGDANPRPLTEEACKAALSVLRKLINGHLKKDLQKKERGVE
jgi:transcriptional regulator NrdR family protein